MKYVTANASTVAVGLAFGPIVSEFVSANPGLVDYVEIPFEQLRHTPEVGSIQETVPVILHCASMSVAGFVPPPEGTLEAIQREAVRTKTPWIGEHLAFLTADPIEADLTPTSLTYTVCPQLSEETVERVALNLASLQQHFDVPLILENSPQYFDVPGSSLSMADFVSAVVERCRVGLLLDLTHFLISMINTKKDPLREVERLPLEQVIEVHISGLNVQSGIAWDDHASPAPPVVFDLLESVLKRVRPKAVTLEYNWSPQFPESMLVKHIDRIHELVRC
ncbi:MAG TPA: DUF692 family protein [Pyrinomonadaceae bacterium]|jgi:uncharacterized protein (UPF0276 family)|nr:DUF692 family protein [Pyrinomonadaceae bacterium]